MKSNAEFQRFLKNFIIMLMGIYFLCGLKRLLYHKNSQKFFQRKRVLTANKLNKKKKKGKTVQSSVQRNNY